VKHKNSGTCSEGFALRYIALLPSLFENEPAITARPAFGGQTAPMADKIISLNFANSYLYSP